MQVEWQDAQADILVFVRSEAAGMVTGKQGASKLEIFVGSITVHTVTARLRSESDPKAVWSTSAAVER